MPESFAILPEDKNYAPTSNEDLHAPCRKALP